MLPPPTDEQCCFRPSESIIAFILRGHTYAPFFSFVCIFNSLIFILLERKQSILHLLVNSTNGTTARAALSAGNSVWIYQILSGTQTLEWSSAASNCVLAPIWNWRWSWDSNSGTGTWDVGRIYISATPDTHPIYYCSLQNSQFYCSTITIERIWPHWDQLTCLKCRRFL